MVMSPNELIYIALLGVGVVGVLVLGEVLRRRTKLNQEVTRKFVHIFAGFAALPMPFVFSTHWPVLLLTGSFLLIIIITGRLKSLQSVHGVERNSAGAYLYPMSIYLLFVLAGDRPLFFIIPMLVLLFSDSLAAVIGKTYGLIHYRVGEGQRSLEGSIVFFIVAFVLIHALILLSNSTGRVESLLIAFILAVLITGFEAISGGGWDNLYIPLSTFFFLEHLVVLSTPQILPLVGFVIILAGICALPYTYKQLTISGAIEVFLIGMMFVILGGIHWILPVMGVYVMYRLPSFGFREIRTAVVDPTRPLHKGRRVISLNFPLLVCVLMNSYSDQAFWYQAYLVGIGGQLGLLWNGQFDASRGLMYSERLDVNFQHVMNSLVSVALALIYYYFFGPEAMGITGYVVMGFLALLPFYLQRIYTAKFQYVGTCQVCGFHGDRTEHCDKPTTYLRGYEGVTHDQGMLIVISISMVSWLIYNQIWLGSF